MTEPAWLSITGDICTMIGLLVTGVVWWQTRRIKTYFLMNARLDGIALDLQKHANSLTKALGAWPNQENRAIEIATNAGSVLDMAKGKLTGPAKHKVRSASSLIRKRKRIVFGWQNGSDEERLEMYTEIYVSIRGAITALEQLKKDYDNRG